jgi:hypothetical protein
MNWKTIGGRGLRRAAGFAVMAAVTLLTAGCIVHVRFGSAPAQTAQPPYQVELAYAQCMRTHGLPGFPDPSPSGSFSGQPTGNPDSPAARANDACKHLLPGGGTAVNGAAGSATAGPSGGAVATECLASQPKCYTPQQLRVAYGIQSLLDRGITGSGQTVVLLEFPPQAAAGTQVPPAASDIRQDLARFDSVFGLPAARLQVVNALAHAASPWLASTEEVADTSRRAA